MGNKSSAAREQAEKANEKIDSMLQVLSNKLEAITLEIVKKRGGQGSNSTTEVAGGRSVMRLQEIRVTTQSGVDNNIRAALSDFFDAAQGTLGSDKQKPKTAAVEGARKLVTAGLDALFGVQNGQGMEKQSFVVLFLNNTFVRVDYYCYSYSISAKMWGAEANKSGVCYAADLAVLDMAKLSASEIDFLLSQALAVSDKEFSKLQEIKIRLNEVAILSRALQKENLSFDELVKIVEDLKVSQEAIDSTFNKLED